MHPSDYGGDECDAASSSLSVAAAAIGWPIVTRAQQPALPVVAFVNAGFADGLAPRATAFRKGLSETGYVEGQNVTVEYHWLEGRNDRLPALMAEIVHRQVAVIATPGSVVTSLAAKSATPTIPIVFGVPEDPVGLGLVSNLARPGGNATGINTFSQEVIGKRLKLLHDLVPKAARVAVLVDPNNVSSARITVQEVQKAAQGLGLVVHVFNATTISEIDAAFAVLEKAAQGLGLVVHVFNATTISEIDAAFAVLAGEHFDALYVAPDAFFNSRGVQFATLTARERIPATFSSSEIVSVGGLISYGSDLEDMSQQVGVYTGRILKGERPAELPVVQSTKLTFAVNLQTARSLGIEVPSGVVSIADVVIE